MRRLILILLVAVLAVPVYGQYRKSSRKKKTPFAENVWLGVNLTDFSFSSRSFSMGLTPMGAYRVSPNVSLGGFIRMAYRYENVGQSNNPNIPDPKIKYETFDVGPGILGRFDLRGIFPENGAPAFLLGLFVQADLEFAFEQLPVIDPNTGEWIIENDKVITERTQTNYAYLGAGYSSGEVVKFNISAHYNVTDNINSQRSLWDIRFGVQWDLVPPDKKTSNRQR